MPTNMNTEPMKDSSTAHIRDRIRTAAEPMPLRLRGCLASSRVLASWRETLPVEGYVARGHEARQVAKKVSLGAKSPQMEWRAYYQKSYAEPTARQSSTRTSARASIVRCVAIEDREARSLR